MKAVLKTLTFGLKVLEQQIIFALINNSKLKGKAVYFQTSMRVMIVIILMVKECYAPHIQQKISIVVYV